MRVFFLLVLFFFLGLGQAVFPQLVIFGGIKPPLLMTGVFYYATRHQSGVSALAAAVAGLVHVYLGWAPWWVMFVFFFAIRAAMQRGRKVVTTDVLRSACAFGALWSLAMQGVFFVLMPFLDRTWPPVDTVLIRFVVAVPLGWISVGVLFPVLARLEHRLGLEQKREEEEHASV